MPVGKKRKNDDKEPSRKKRKLKKENGGPQNKQSKKRKREVEAERKQNKKRRKNKNSTSGARSSKEEESMIVQTQKRSGVKRPTESFSSAQRSKPQEGLRQRNPKKGKTMLQNRANRNVPLTRVNGSVRQNQKNQNPKAKAGSTTSFCIRTLFFIFFVWAVIFYISLNYISKSSLPSDEASSNSKTSAAQDSHHRRISRSGSDDFDSLLSTVQPGRYHIIFDQNAYDLYQYEASKAGETGKKYKDMYLQVYRTQIQSAKAHWAGIYDAGKTINEKRKTCLTRVDSSYSDWLRYGKQTPTNAISGELSSDFDELNVLKMALEDFNTQLQNVIEEQNRLYSSVKETLQLPENFYKVYSRNEKELNLQKKLVTVFGALQCDSALPDIYGLERLKEYRNIICKYEAITKAMAGEINNARKKIGEMILRNTRSSVFAMLGFMS